MFLEDFSTASPWEVCKGMKRQLQRQDERKKHREGGNGQKMLLPSDSECVNVRKEWDKVVPVLACTPPWICGCRPSDPFPGKWMRPMLSATDASTKTPFPSPPPPQSPSSLKVSELAKEGIEFQQSPNYLFPACSVKIDAFVRWQSDSLSSGSLNSEGGGSLESMTSPFLIKQSCVGERDGLTGC